MIREFEEKDAKELSDLITRNIKINNSRYNVAIVDKFCRKYSPEEIIKKSKISLIVVLEEKGKLIGTGTLEGNYINAIYINLESQSQGFGSLILEFLEGKAKEKGESWVKLHGTRGSFGFYEKKGYVVDHIVEGKTNGKTYFMTKKLI